MKQDIRVILFAAASLTMGFLCNCATIMHGNTQEVYISSDPEGAQLTIDKKAMGVAPQKVRLERNKSHHVELALQDRRPHSAILRKEVSGWFWGNLGCIGVWPVCFAIDFFDGSMYKLHRDTLLLTLESGTPAIEGAQGSDPVETRNIAVLDLKSMGVGDHVSLLLTEKLRSIFFKTGRFTVMNREDMTKVLEEQSFQHSENCDTPECLAEIGKMLGVATIITGSIGKLGSTYSLTLKQINIESSKNEKIINLSEKCEEDDLFTMIEKGAKQLMRSPKK